MKKVMLVMLDILFNIERMLSLFRAVFTEEIDFFTFLHLAGLDIFSRVH